MKESVMWLIGWLIAGATVVGLALVIAFSIHNTSTLHNEKVTTCIESGGTWVDYNSLCIAPGSVTDSEQELG